MQLMIQQPDPDPGNLCLTFVIPFKLQPSFIERSWGVQKAQIVFISFKNTHCFPLSKQRWWSGEQPSASVCMSEWEQAKTKREALLSAFLWCHQNGPSTMASMCVCVSVSVRACVNVCMNVSGWVNETEKKTESPTATCELHALLGVTSCTCATFSCVFPAFPVYHCSLTIIYSFSLSVYFLCLVHFSESMC